MIKTHHCFTDGLGLGTFFLSLSGEYDSKALPALKPLPLSKKILIWIFMPYLFLKNGLSIVFTCRNFNSIKRNEKMTGKKNGAFTTDLDLAEMKAYCKQQNCTINDYTTAVISNTLYDYFERHRSVNGKEFKIP